MDAIWFYLDEGQQRGPLTLEELAAALRAAPEPRRVGVWREGLTEWQAAGSVPEIRERLPPPRPSLQPSGSVPLAQVEAMAVLYRRLVLLIGLEILLQILQISLSRTSEVLVMLLSLALIAVVVMTVILAYKLSRALGEGAPVLWAVAMFIPCLNIIMLLVLSSRAQAWCQRYGIKVGLLGPTKESLEEFRRRVLTADFE